MKFILPSAALAVTIAMALCTTTAADFKLSPPVVEGMEYVGIEPYIEVQSELFDSTIERLHIDIDLTIDVCAVQPGAERSRVYYEAFPETDSVQKRVLILSHNEWGAGLYSEQGRILTGYRLGAGTKYMVVTAYVFDDALYYVEGGKDEDGLSFTTISPQGKLTAVFDHRETFDMAAGLRDDLDSGLIQWSWLTEEEQVLVEKARTGTEWAEYLTLSVGKPELMALSDIAQCQSVTDVTEWIVKPESIYGHMRLIVKLGAGEWRDIYYNQSSADTK